MWEFSAAVLLAVSGAAVTFWAVQRTQHLADQSERRRMRRDVLRRLVGTRHMIIPGAKPGQGEFYAALNEVVVAFSDDDEVIEALRQFDKLVARGFQPEDLNLLVQPMARAAEMGPLDEHLLEHFVAPNPSTGQRRP